MNNEQARVLLRIMRDFLVPPEPMKLSEYKEAITMAIQSLQQPTVSQWIPCSERLPELKKWVLVSSGDCVVSDCLVIRDGNKIWYECGTIDIENDAWMPLPEPYKEA